MAMAGADPYRWSRLLSSLCGGIMLGLSGCTLAVVISRGATGPIVVVSFMVALALALIAVAVVDGTAASHPRSTMGLLGAHASIAGVIVVSNSLTTPHGALLGICIMLAGLSVATLRRFRRDRVRAAS